MSDVKGLVGNKPLGYEKMINHVKDNPNYKSALLRTFNQQIFFLKLLN